MRQTIRAASKEGLPADRRRLRRLARPGARRAGPGEARRRTLLKGLPKTKTVATWIPWTNSRLSYRSGYGAGVTAPGWYEHLWTHPEQPTLRWTVRAARTLREEDSACSDRQRDRERPSRRGARLAARPRQSGPPRDQREHAGGAVRRRDRAARVRARPAGDWAAPGRGAARDARRSAAARARGRGAAAPAQTDRRDQDARSRPARPTDRARSHLFHRLRLLEIEWGKPETVSGKSGTFHELWQLRWRPELEIAIVEASRWGNTFAVAAGTRAIDLANKTEDLGPLTEILDKVVVAELDDALGRVLAIVQARAAVASDVIHLVDALPRLARLSRYGDVRGLSAEPVLALFDGIYERVLVGLPNACTSLDDDAAAAMANAWRKFTTPSASSTGPTDAVLARRRREPVRARRRPRRSFVAAARLAHDKVASDDDELARLASLALSRAVPPNEVAAWVEGLLRGGALLLMHAHDLWTALDGWLAELSDDAFDAVLPLLRRAFSAFSGPERRSMGERSSVAPGHWARAVRGPARRGARRAARSSRPAGARADLGGPP